MNLIATKRAPEEKVTQFLAENEHVDKHQLYTNGYVVEVNDKIEGCFVLQPVSENVYWLRQLHIKQHAAATLPVLLEAILVLAKECKARTVYVHSHQPLVDMLLQALQFHPQEKNEFVDKHADKKGSWWTYSVS